METDPEGSVSAGYAAICGIGVGSMRGPSPGSRSKRTVCGCLGWPVNPWACTVSSSGSPLAGGPLGD